MKNLIVLILFFSCSAHAKLNVITSTTDLRAIAAEVGKDFVNVDSIAKGTQDPHFVEAKPSFMVKVHQADLLILVGLDLEVGWAPSIIAGARNPKVVKGQKGYLEVGPEADPVEVPTGAISRAEGDVHPFGNPHVTLDPIRTGKIAQVIAKRLGELDSSHSQEYLKNATALQERMQSKTKTWQARITKSNVKKVVSYHKTLTYFFERFHVDNPMILEPKPGIPPTSGHILEVISAIKQQKIPLILVENYFDPTVTNKIKQEVPDVRAVTVAVSVEGDKGINNLDDLYENLVKSFEKRALP